MDDLWPLPISDWIGDETLFSLCSRIHVLTGNVFSHATSQVLFGHPKRGTQHDFPTHLSHFEHVTRGQLGNTFELVRRTLLPYFLSWKPPSIAEQAISQACSGGVGAMKFRLGITSSRFRAHFPLKACDECMAQDLSTFGVACWHLQHQYPGVWMCVTHSRPLRESQVKSTGVGRFLWVLPTDQVLGPTPRPPEATSRSLLALAKLTNDAITAMPSGGLRPEVLARAYSTATTGGDSIARSHLMRELGAEYARCVAPLRAIPELEPLARDARQGLSQIQPVLSGRRWITHPLRHFAVILWLFSDWKAFKAAYSLARNLPIENDQPVQRTPSTAAIDGRQDELAAALSRGASVTAAAKMVGVTVNTAIAWATKAAMTTPRRPKRTQEHTRKLIIQALKNGEGKCEIASRHEVTVQTVTRILLSEIGLQERWHEVVMRKRQLAARQEWTTAMQQNGDASRKMLRAIAPRAFAWLYRNDRAWLIEQQRLARPSTPGKRQTVDWGSRDESLARCVERIALELYHSDPLMRITLQQLYQAIPELKRRLGQLSHLPLTRSRIDRVTARARLGNQDRPLL